jgi:poly-gamma-glutamate capsule biosynthesis protein CapA/YwtB (metallophosphatase superfamily)
MSITLALAGDTMLGRMVGPRVATEPFESIVHPAVRDVMAGADLTVLNLECCVSDRGQRWSQPGKPFFFRAPPRAADLLAWLGVDCVSLANNHALDYGPLALRDTRAHLGNAGVLTVGAGVDVESARSWRLLEAAGFTVGVLGVTDHPADFAAGTDWAGVAYAELRHGLPDWLRRQVGAMAAVVDLTLVTPHWGPNMTSEPVQHVRTAARALLDAGAGLVAGHSAHVIHGVAGPVLYDLGDFIDDYAVDQRLRNDLGLLFVVTVDEDGPAALEALPLALDYCYTRPADAAELTWLQDRFTTACARFGTEVGMADGRLTAALR